MILGQNKQLQDELKLDKDQITTKSTKPSGKAGRFHGDEISKLMDATPEERTELVKKMMETSTKAVEALLKPETWISRLHQIENQQACIGMYSKAEVQKTLKLTDEQKTKIEKIDDEDYRTDSSRNSEAGLVGQAVLAAAASAGAPTRQLAKKQEALKIRRHRRKSPRCSTTLSRSATQGPDRRTVRTLNASRLILAAVDSARRGIWRQYWLVPGQTFLRTCRTRSS